MKGKTMKKIIVPAIIGIAFMIFNCGEDNPIDTSKGIIVLLTASEGDTLVGLEETINLTAGVYNTTNRAIKWYVNDIENGDSILGTIGDISDTSATYTAPDTLTASERVTVKIVSQADTSKFDTYILRIFDPVYVYVNPDPDIGDDVTGTGTNLSPYRTITHALNTASIGQTVIAMTGTYTEGLPGEGETFPLMPGYKITVSGQGIDQTIIRAPASRDADSAAFLLQSDSIVIRSLSIVGTSSGNDFYGIGINFAPGSDTSSAELHNAGIDSCYKGIVNTAAIRGILSTNGLIENCEYGIVIDSTADSLMIKHCTFSNIKNTALRVNSPLPKIQFEFCRFNNIDSIAVDINSAGCNLFSNISDSIDGSNIGYRIGTQSGAIIQGAYFNAIDSIGVLIDSGASAMLSIGFIGDNDFQGCNNWCVYNASDDTINALRNFWPASDSAGIDAVIYDDEESSGTSGPVLFIPWGAP
jgi:hypothetical protein